MKVLSKSDLLVVIGAGVEDRSDELQRIEDMGGCVFF